MTESLYKFIELVGTSEKGWEDAVNSIIQTASGSLRDLRIAEVIKLDVKIDQGKPVLYRARVKISFKFEQ